MKTQARILSSILIAQADRGTSEAQGPLDWVRHRRPSIQPRQSHGRPAHQKECETCLEPVGRGTQLAELPGIPFEVRTAAVFAIELGAKG